MLIIDIEDERIAFEMFKTIDRLRLCRLLLMDPMFRAYGDIPFDVMERLR